MCSISNTSNKCLWKFPRMMYIKAGIQSGMVTHTTNCYLKQTI